MKLKTFSVAAALVLASSNAVSAVVWKYGMSVGGVQSLPDGGFIIYGPSGVVPKSMETMLFWGRANKNGMSEAGVKVALETVLTACASGKALTSAHDNAAQYG